MIRLYVFLVATQTVIAVFTCDPSDTNNGDAAAGCEHAAGDEYRSAEYGWAFSSEGLTISEDVKFTDCPPLSKSTPRPMTREEAEQHVADVVAEAKARVAAFGHEVN